MKNHTWESFWSKFGIVVSKEYKRIQFVCDYIEKGKADKKQKDMIEKVTGLPWNHPWCLRLMRESFYNYHNMNCNQGWEAAGLS